MRERKLLALEKKAYKLQREMAKILDEIYEADEIFGEEVEKTIKERNKRD